MKPQGKIQNRILACLLIQCRTNDTPCWKTRQLFVMTFYYSVEQQIIKSMACILNPKQDNHSRKDDP